MSDRRLALLIRRRRLPHHLVQVGVVVADRLRRLRLAETRAVEMPQQRHRSLVVDPATRVGVRSTLLHRLPVEVGGEFLPRLIGRSQLTLQLLHPSLLLRESRPRVEPALAETSPVRRSVFADELLRQTAVVLRLDVIRLRRGRSRISNRFRVGGRRIGLLLRVEQPRDRRGLVGRRAPVEVRVSHQSMLHLATSRMSWNAARYPIWNTDSSLTVTVPAGGWRLNALASR